MFLLRTEAWETCIMGMCDRHAAPIIGFGLD
jgi:hypothetical protein